MSNFSFREAFIFKILNGFDNQKGPLDHFLRKFFRANKTIGSKDRRFISESIYTIIRWKGLIDYFACLPVSDTPPTWERRYQTFKTMDIPSLHSQSHIPLHSRVSFPQFFFQMLLNTLGEEKAVEFCLASNQSAPTTIRVNTLKTTRDQLLQLWDNIYEVSPCQISPCGIVFHKKVNFFELPEFQ